MAAGPPSRTKHPTTTGRYRTATTAQMSVKGEEKEFQKKTAKVKNRSQLLSDDVVAQR